jgi:C_GCAxxG_C_C family probable redox protein
MPANYALQCSPARLRHMGEDVELNLNHPAITRFLSGFNCAQSVFAEFGPQMGLTEEQALKLASGFGGGMAHTGSVCGAVTASMLAIGLKYGASEGRNAKAKLRTYKIINGMMDEFMKRHGSIMCTDLLCYDLSDPQQLQEAIASGSAHLTCPKYILTAIELTTAALETA